MKLDEFEIGDIFITPKVTLTASEIIDFATRYDPHYFHVDEIAARDSLFGRLVASGMHSLALLNAEFCKMDVLGRDIQGGLHLDASWVKPVYADDTIYGEFSVKDKEVSSPKSHMGLLILSCVGKKEDGETFANSTIQVLVTRNM